MKWAIAGGISLLLLVIVLVALPHTARAGAINYQGPPPPAPPDPRLAKGPPPPPSLKQTIATLAGVPGAKYIDKYDGAVSKVAGKVPGGQYIYAAANPIQAPATVAKVGKKVWGGLKSIF